MRIVTLYELDLDDVIRAIAAKYNTTLDKVTVGGVVDRDSFKISVEQVASEQGGQVLAGPAILSLDSVPKEYNTPPQSNSAHFLLPF